jgi:hypothetical protein
MSGLREQLVYAAERLAETADNNKPHLIAFVRQPEADSIVVQDGMLIWIPSGVDFDAWWAARKARRPSRVDFDALWGRKPKKGKCK